MNVELPYRFPNHAEEIYREAQEFRRLSPTERLLAIVDMMVTSETLLANSPHREEALRAWEAQEAEWQRVHRELFARHGF